MSMHVTPWRMRSEGVGALLPREDRAQVPRLQHTPFPAILTARHSDVKFPPLISVCLGDHSGVTGS